MRHCKKVDLGGGDFAIVCGGRDRAPCSVPGCRRTHTKLCDHPVTRAGKAGTCDAKLCPDHATNAGPDRDLCPPHAKAR